MASASPIVSNSRPLPSSASQTRVCPRSSCCSSLAFSAHFPIAARNFSISPVSSSRFISVLSIAPRKSVRPFGVFALDPDFYKIPYVEGVPVGKRLKIWNLPPNTDPEEFRAWFDGLEGVSVESVEFTDDPELNAQGVGGFIEFGTKQEACMAIVRRDGYKFKGRCVRMDFVEKKPHEREIGGRRNRPTYRNNSMSSSNRSSSSGSYGYGGGATSPFFASRNSGSSGPVTGSPAPSGLTGSTPATSPAGSPATTFNNGNLSPTGYGSPPSSVSSSPRTGYGNVPSTPTTGGTAATINGNTPSPSGGNTSTGFGTAPPMSSNTTATGYGSAPPPSVGAASTINGSNPIPSSGQASTGFGNVSSTSGYGNAPNVSGTTGYGSAHMSNSTAATASGSPPIITGSTAATGYGSLIPNTRNYSSNPTSAMSNSGPILAPKSNVPSSSSSVENSGPSSFGDNNNLGSGNYGSPSNFGARSATSPYQATSTYNNIQNQSTSSYGDARSAQNYVNPTYGSSQSSPNYGSPQAPSGYASYGRESQLNDMKQFSFDSSESSDVEYGTSHTPSYGGAQSTPGANYGRSTMQSASTYGNATQFSNSYGQNDSSFSGGSNYSNYNAAGTPYSRSGYSQGYGNSGYGSPRPSSSNRIFVGNLPWSTDDMSLQQLFSEFGNVLDARVVKDRETGRSRGFGFVSMSTVEEMDSAIQGLDGRQVDGRAIRVNQAESRF